MTNCVHDALFTRAGFTCRVVEDGQAAIASCLESPPDVVVMDVDMPILDGISAMKELSRLQAVGALPPIGIVATSAIMEPDRARQCIAAGARIALSKPIEPVELLRAVRSAAEAGREGRGSTRANDSPAPAE